MITLLDANVLLRVAEPSHKQHKVTIQALETLQKLGHCIIISQAMYEFWAVATRPISKNGLGFSVEDAESFIIKLKTMFEFWDGVNDTFETWLNLVKQHSISGVHAHDVRYAATVIQYDLDCLLTFNKKDFVDFPIHVQTPIDIVKS
jgi:predicted nucleic acid-binding protein